MCNLMKISWLIKSIPFLSGIVLKSFTKRDVYDGWIY